MGDHPPEVYFYYHSPLGLIKICGKDGFITRAIFIEQGPESKLLQSESIPLNSLLQNASKQLDEYFDGIREKFDLALKPHGTFFQRFAWKSLHLIPYGETISYLQQAESLGNSKAIRAVGQANAKNPIPIFIPCHRVIGKNGSLTGYAGGLDRKTKLLEMETRFKHE